MTTQRSVKSRTLTVHPSKKATIAKEKTKVKPKMEIVRAKASKKTGLEPNRPPAKARKVLSGGRTAPKDNRQTEIKLKQALTEDQVDLVTEQPVNQQEVQVKAKRSSFIIRLALDDYGQFARTEIEHVASNNKQSFSGLDGERLVAFMKSCSNPMVIPTDVIDSSSASDKQKAPTLGPQKSSLNISDIRVFRPSVADLMTLVLTPGESFVVQIRFQLRGPDSQLLITHASSFDIKLYGIEITRGKTQLLATHSAKLIQDVFEYTIPVEVPWLQPGLYRLFTVVTLRAQITLTSFYGKTILHVI